MHKTRNVIVVVGALAIWLVAMAAIFLAGAQALDTFATSWSSGIGGVFLQYIIRFLIHTVLGFVVGFVVGLGVISNRPVRWGLATAAIMVSLALFNTVDHWFLAIQIQFQAMEVATAILPSIACIIGCIAASKLVEKSRVTNAL